MKAQVIEDRDDVMKLQVRDAMELWIQMIRDEVDDVHVQVFEDNEFQLGGVP